MADKMVAVLSRFQAPQVLVSAVLVTLVLSFATPFSVIESASLASVGVMSVALLTAAAVGWKETPVGFSVSAVMLSAGLVWRSLELLYPDTFPAGHSMYIIGAAVLASAKDLPAFLSQRSASRTEAERQDLEFSGRSLTLLYFDILFCTLTVVLATWRIAFKGYDHTSLIHNYWTSLLSVFVFTALTAVIFFSFLGRWNFVNMSLMIAVVARLVAEFLGTSPPGISDATGREVLVPALTVSMIGLACFTSMAHTHVIADGEMNNDRHQAFWASMFALLALAPMLWSFAEHPDIDPTGAFLGGCIIVCFLTREVFRARTNEELIATEGSIAMTDVLTGLANRRSLNAYLDKANFQHRDVGIALIDIDRFRLVNEQSSHSLGDDILTGVGTALADVAKRHDGEAFRTSGDEFAIVVPGTYDFALQAIEEARAQMAEAADFLYPNMGLGASGGFAHTADLGASDHTVVVTHAAEALILAKQTRGCLYEYTEDIAQAVVRQNTVARRLRSALENSEVTFNFQPIVSVSTGAMAGFEALARWQDSELGHVPPSEFVPIAERTGLIHQLGMAALTSAIRALVETDREGTTFVSVNVSPIQLRSRYFVESIRALVAHHNIDTGRVKLEVTENIFIDNNDPALECVRNLSALGFHIALDDFGAGYSSMGYMSRIPFNTIKLDRSVTDSIDDDTIRSIVEALAKASGPGRMDLVPEGVETSQGADMLAALGVTIAQGWYWNKAVSLPELHKYVAAHGTMDQSLLGSADVR